MATKAKSKKRTVKRPAKRTVKKTVRRSNNRKQVRKTSRKVVSYGVKFTRRKNLSEIRGPNGWVNSPGKIRTSTRRFATRREAMQHGRRFKKIEGHKAFSVFKSTDRVNAWINWITGKTNPIIWLRRKDRS